MKRSRLAAVCVLLRSGCGATAATEQHTVALVAKSTQTEFWLSVFAGAEAAATEYNLKLTITGPETEEDYEAQNRMVADAVAAGAEALVFSAADRDTVGQAVVDAANGKKPGAGFTLAADTRETGGGVVLQRGRMEINCGFAELLRRARQEDSSAVAAVLFD